MNRINNYLVALVLGAFAGAAASGISMARNR